ncbi:MAG TPA: hypothetical protein VJX74_01760 [Blastocatellia bacterium]|nr:hypothetical protein [Blastocatellia bacterium]
MEKRTDDRDAKKSIDEATDDPREANKSNEGEQAAELQVGEEGERDDPNRFEPDSKEAETKHVTHIESKDIAQEP